MNMFLFKQSKTLKQISHMEYSRENMNPMHNYQNDEAKCSNVDRLHMKNNNSNL